MGGQDAVRPDQGLHADRPGRRAAAGRGHQARLAVQLAAGHRQSGEGQARRSDLRLGRQRRLGAPRRRRCWRRSPSTKMTHVPFRGNAPALAEVMAGRVSFMFYPMVGIADQVAQKRLKVLAITTDKRHPDFPARPRPPRPASRASTSTRPASASRRPPACRRRSSARLNEAIRASLAKPETRERLRRLGAIDRGRLRRPAEFQHLGCSRTASAGRASSRPRA